jgi:hypothetical protein
MLRPLRLLAIAAATLVATGCATFGTYQTARTAGKGGTQIGLEGSYWGLSHKDPETGNTATTTLPSVNVSGRYGITEDIDLAARAGSAGLEIGGKFQIAGKAKDQVAVSIAPMVSYISVSASSTTENSSSSSLLALQVPVLLGIPVGDHELVLGPKFQVWRAGSDSKQPDGTTATSSATLFNVGASIGFALKLGTTFRVLPEVAFVTPVAVSASASNGQASASKSDFVNANGALIQFGIAFLFGGN